MSKTRTRKKTDVTKKPTRPNPLEVVFPEQSDLPDGGDDKRGPLEEVVDDESKDDKK